MVKRNPASEQLSLDDLLAARPPACAAPTKSNPGGRTGTIMGHEAHNRAGEPVCSECREAKAVYQRSRYVKKDPAVVAAERAARTVARRAEYEGRPVCAVPSSKFPDGRTGTNAGYYTHTGIGENPCDECRAANREYSKARISLRKEAGFDGLACAVPSAQSPEGRTGTSQGYFAHYYLGQEPCTACLEGHAAETKAKRKSNPLAYRNQALRSKFRITLDDYRRMLTDQGGGCAICGTTEPGHAGRSKYGGFHVDHDHSCCPGDRACGGCVRGLLCGACNTGMGNLGDDPERLIAAANYLLGARKRRSDAETSAQAGDAA